MEPTEAMAPHDTMNPAPPEPAAPAHDVRATPEADFPAPTPRRAGAELALQGLRVVDFIRWVDRPPEEAAKTIQNETVRRAALVKKAGITVD